MNKNLTMNDLYIKLSTLGFSREFIRAIGLPSWWVDELDQSSSYSVMLESAGHVSKRLYVNLRSLVYPNKKARFINNMTYDEVISLLRLGKKQLLEHPELISKEDDGSLWSDNARDYFEQLLELEL
jgi:hypothetical protein